MWFMIDVFPYIFSIVFLFIIFGISIAFIKTIAEWNKNNKSPILSVQASIVSRRNAVSRHHHSNGHNSSSTTYYVTFEFDSKDRLELRVPRDEFGYLAEQDTGSLTFQGTRFLKFERN